MLHKILIVVLLAEFLLISANPENLKRNAPDCSGLSPELVAEIRSYQPIANRILLAATAQQFKGHLYKELGSFVDQFSQRWTGTSGLDQAIDFMMDKMRRDGLTNVRNETVIPPYKWTRGEERAELIEPFRKKMNVMAQTPSVPTEGIEAEVIVFSDLDELEQNQAKVPGKIVLFDYTWISYNDALPYRRQASSMAAKYGAVATLIRSTTPFSLQSPHTSGVSYDPNFPRIPTGSLTVEDSALLRRLQQSGKTIRLKLILINSLDTPTPTRNSYGDLQGTTYPDEIVIVAGHIDSLDVGTGALDDGSGVFLATESLVLLQSLGLRPKRTIRALLFTAEEMGLIGAIQYVEDHKNELNKTVVALEADQGAFHPLGLDFGGSEAAACIVNEVLQLIGPSLNATTFGWYNITDPVSSDIYMLQLEGVPGIGNNVEGQWDYYFWFHHSEADTMSTLKSEELDMNLALWATVSYVLADISVALPRDGGIVDYYNN